MISSLSFDDLCVLDSSKGDIEHIAFSEYGDYIVVVTSMPSQEWTYNVSMYELPTGRIVLSLDGNKSISSAAVSNGGNYVAIGIGDELGYALEEANQCIIVNVRNNRQFSWPCFGLIDEIRFSSDERYVILSYFASEDFVSYVLLDTATAKEVQLGVAFDEISFLTFDGDETQLAIGAFNNEIKIYNTDDWQLRAEFALHDAIVKISYAAQGRLLAIGEGYWMTGSGNLRVIDAESLESKFVAKDVNANTYSVSPSGRLLVYETGSYQTYINGVGGEIRIVDLDTGKSVFEMSKDKPGTFAVTPQETHLMVCSEDGEIHFFSLETGALVSTYNIGTSIESIQFSPSGRYAAYMGWEGLELIINTETYTEAELPSYGTMQLSPSWNRIASTGPDGSIKIWQLVDP